MAVGDGELNQFPWATIKDHENVEEGEVDRDRRMCKSLRLRRDNVSRGDKSRRGTRSDKISVNGLPEGTMIFKLASRFLRAQKGSRQPSKSRAPAAEIKSGQLREGLKNREETKGQSTRKPK